MEANLITTNSRKSQQMKVAYQGIRGAYSETAVYRHFGRGTKAVGYDDPEDVLEAVTAGKAEFGLLPFENTIAGSVARNYNLLLKQDVCIIAEVFLKITHNLLSRKGNSLDNIKLVYSHHHALEQCREFIRKNKLKAVPVYDTAGAAKIVSVRGRKDEAAIASEFCAGIYSLDAIEKDIAANKNNITKFFVFVKTENSPKNIVGEKTSIAFKTKHSPGALMNCLQALSKHGINLTKLESRPIPENPWEFVFYTDFEGSINDSNVKLGLKKMEASSMFLKVLGSYPRGKK